jgi:hypothetical protein
MQDVAQILPAICRAIASTCLRLFHNNNIRMMSIVMPGHCRARCLLREMKALQGQVSLSTFRKERLCLFRRLWQPFLLVVVVLQICHGTDQRVDVSQV